VTNAAKTVVGLILALGIACTKQAPDADRGVAPKPQPQPQPPPKPQPTGDVSVELSSVTLGDDCDADWTPPAPAKPAATQAAPASPAMRAAASCPQGVDCGGGRARGTCRQTSIQLALQATGTSDPTPIRIKKVELLDESGAFLAELPASNPKRWSDAGSYQPWDQTVAPG
jgi:hypothetical protein